MPGLSGVTVVTNACAFYTTHAAAGALGARHSLRPLIGGRKLMANLARFRRRDREAALADDSLLLKFASVSHRHCAGCSFDHTLRMTTRPGRSTSCRLIVARRCYSLPSTQSNDSSAHLDAQSQALPSTAPESKP